MCGRFTNMGRHGRAVILFKKMGLLPPSMLPRYNIAPTQNVPVVLREFGESPDSRDLRWGLIPFWARDKSVGVRAINARAETVDEKNTFREAFKSRRCLVPADGFYEWKRDAATKTKTPYYFTAANGDDPLVFAGLWERWERGAERIESFTIVTTTANRLMEPIHDRMPVILREDDWADWIDPGTKDTRHLKSLLRPAGDDVLQCWEVGPYVNNVRHEGEKCIEKAS